MHAEHGKRGEDDRRKKDGEKEAGSTRFRRASVKGLEEPPGLRRACLRTLLHTDHDSPPTENYFQSA